MSLYFLKPNVLHGITDYLSFNMLMRIKVVLHPNLADYHASGFRLFSMGKQS